MSLANQTLGNLALGLAGGIAGLLAMDTVMKHTSRFVAKPRPRREDEDSIGMFGNQHGPEESATDALGRIAYERATGHPPSERARKTASYAVHYGYGLTMAALYGVVRGRAIAGPDPIGGALFGAALWALGDEAIVPLLGLADKPTRFPPSMHAQTLLGHVAYGAATGTVAGALRKLAEAR